MPVRPHVRPSEALDSYLVRLARANGLTPRALSEEITARAGAPVINGRAVLAGYTPMSAIVTTIADMGGLASGHVIDMTLARYLHGDAPGPGTRLPWTPRHGTAICPQCVGTHGFWPITWRLPQLAVCIEHRLVLHTMCPRCGKPFRTRRTPPLPNSLLECDSPISGSGTFVETCGQRLDALMRIDANPAQVDAAAILLAVTHDGHDVQVAGKASSAVDYLSDHYALVLLLTHLAASGNGEEYYWAKTIRDDALARNASKQQLSRSLPLDMVARAEILALATEMLTRTTVAEVAHHLRLFARIIPSAPAGPRAWLLGHTRRTPFMDELTRAVVAPERSFSYQLDHSPSTGGVGARHIPQAISAPVYEQYFADALGVTADTGRVFVSLCLARRTLASGTWVSAGELIGIPPRVARQTPMNVSPRLKVPITELVGRVIAVEPLFAQSPPDYRQREQLVLQLVELRELWFDPWRHQHRIPGAADNTFANTCEWLWSTYALGLPYSQRWAHGWNNERRYRYRQWCDRLPSRVSTATVLSRRRLATWGITPR